MIVPVSISKDKTRLVRQDSQCLWSYLSQLWWVAYQDELLNEYVDYYGITGVNMIL